MKRSLFLFILSGLSFELQSQINLAHSGWEEASTYPGGKVDDGSGFVLNNRLFFGCGIDEFYRLRNQWYSYDLQTKQWFEIDSIHGNPRQYASTFTSNDFGFVVGGVPLAPHPWPSAGASPGHSSPERKPAHFP